MLFNHRTGIKILAAAMTFTAIIATERTHAENSDTDVPVFITLGQSNADGSAMFDATIDSAMLEWYSSEANTGLIKIWYKSTKVENQESNALGEASRWAVDGPVEDAESGWMNLWYRNENTLGRTAMNIIHGYGSYSTGSSTDCAQGRRGMEGMFGKEFASAMPETQLYILKLGVSGSFISSWANPADDTNWTYFYENIFKPAISDLLAAGKRPRLAGVWWMQGCADHDASAEYYGECLERLISRINNKLGFNNARVYIGHIIKPGESDKTPTGSPQFGQGVRDAQDHVADAYGQVEIVDTRNFEMQYESAFKGYLHFSHAGVNAIGADLASRVLAEGPENWTAFSTPGKWKQTGTTAVFIPDFGNPDITYTENGDSVTAIIRYPGFNDVKTFVTDDTKNM